mgnify:FL=1
MSDTSNYWFNKIVFRNNEPIKHIISERDFIACKADIVTYASNSFISSSQKELFLDEVQAFGETAEHITLFAATGITTWELIDAEPYLKVFRDSSVI